MVAERPCSHGADGMRNTLGLASTTNASLSRSSRSSRRSCRQLSTGASRIDWGSASNALTLVRASPRRLQQRPLRLRERRQPGFCPLDRLRWQLPMNDAGYPRARNRLREFHLKSIGQHSLYPFRKPTRTASSNAAQVQPARDDRSRHRCSRLGYVSFSKPGAVDTVSASAQVRLPNAVRGFASPLAETVHDPSSRQLGQTRQCPHFGTLASVGADEVKEPVPECNVGSERLHGSGAAKPALSEDSSSRRGTRTYVMQPTAFLPR